MKGIQRSRRAPSQTAAASATAILHQTYQRITTDSELQPLVTNFFTRLPWTVNLSGLTIFRGMIVSASSAIGGVTITGSRSNDHIKAGAGFDTFIETMAAFGRDQFTNADLDKDTFQLSSSFAAGNNANHLHFVPYKGTNTVIYGDRGKAGPSMRLVSIYLATAEAHRSAFVITPPIG